MKKVKAYAVVDKDNPKIDVMDIYATKDIVVEKDELLIEVEIREI